MDYATVRDAMTRLEEAGLGAEMEQVPAANATEALRPHWNLYVPRDEVEEARRSLTKDWAGLVEGDEAVEAMRRGEEVLALDGSAEIACPACGHRFTPAGSDAECPDCGLGLGAGGESDER
jgi:rubrerythrin